MRLLLLVLAGCALIGAGCGASGPADKPAPVSTAAIERGNLSDSVSAVGILTFRARPDGSPFAVVNHADGVYTQLPAAGTRIACGGVLYRVDDRPVLLLCGAVPAYRALRTGDHGYDVAQLNRNLHVSGSAFTARTSAALKKLQTARGLTPSGTLGLDGAVFLPEAVQVADVTGELGGLARPGAPVLRATSDVPEVQVGLDPGQQGDVKPGDRARITLPDNTTATGRVQRLGGVAKAGQGADAAVTIPAYIRLDHPAGARGFDQAPVDVDITTKGVPDALNVPVTAIVGESGGFAVEVVRGNGQRHLVRVQLGLFDDAAGRVQLEGDVREGDRVVVPSL